MQGNTIKVWDIVVRLFHWSLVVTFTICCITDNQTMLHINCGYLVLIIIAIRFIWGFIGTKYARFSEFLVSPKVVLQYIVNVLKNNNSRYIGHNPAGAVMIVSLIATIIMTLITGLLLYGVQGNGPLAMFFDPTLIESNGKLEEVFDDLHELFSNLSIILVIFHFAGVIWAGKQHQENLIKSMFTGNKPKNVDTFQEN